MPDHAELDAVASDFRERGVTCLHGAFTDWVDTLRSGIERNLREPGPHVRRYTPQGAAGLFFGDYCNWQRIPEYRDFVAHSAAVRR